MVALEPSPSGAPKLFSSRTQNFKGETLGKCSFLRSCSLRGFGSKKIPFESDLFPFLFIDDFFSTKGNNHYDKVLCTSNKSRSQYVCMSRLQPRVEGTKIHVQCSQTNLHILSDETLLTLIQVKTQYSHSNLNNFFVAQGKMMMMILVIEWRIVFLIYSACPP